MSSNNCKNFKFFLISPLFSMISHQLHVILHDIVVSDKKKSKTKKKKGTLTLKKSISVNTKISTISKPNSINKGNLIDFMSFDDI